MEVSAPHHYPVPASKYATSYSSSHPSAVRTERQPFPYVTKAPYRSHSPEYRHTNLPPTPPAEVTVAPKMSLPPISTFFDLSRDRRSREEEERDLAYHHHQRDQRMPRSQASHVEARLLPPTPPASYQHENARTSPLMQVPHQASLPQLGSSATGYLTRSSGASGAPGRGSLQSDHSTISSYSAPSAHPSSPESVSSATISTTPLHYNGQPLPHTAHDPRRSLPGEFAPPPLQTANAPPQSPHSSMSSASTNHRGQQGWRYDPYAHPSSAGGMHSQPTSPVTPGGPIISATLASSADRYVCPTCNKAFSRPSSLRIHSHSHTGEKPFQCPHAGCGKAFSVRSNMKRHERGCHIGVAPGMAGMGSRTSPSDADTNMDEEEEEE